VTEPTQEPGVWAHWNLHKTGAAVLGYCASTPSLPPLLTGSIASSDVTSVSGELHTALVQRIEHLLASKPIPAEQRRLAATMSVRILTAVLPDAVAGGKVNPAVAAELKTALTAYLGAATSARSPKPRP
jgi:Tetracyclin repressor-like, C-terminal domain